MLATFQRSDERPSWLSRLAVTVAGLCVSEISGMLNRYASTEALVLAHFLPSDLDFRGA